MHGVVPSRKPLARTAASQTYPHLKATIDSAWSVQRELTSATQGEFRQAVETCLHLMNNGQMRVAEKIDNEWVANTWLKHAILLAFRLYDCSLRHDGVTPTWDKLPLKFNKWTAEDFASAHIRVLPGAIVRTPAHIGRDCVLAPCFVDAGAYVDDACMLDAWSTIGTCAQIGKRVHIAMGAGIGGVLEPEQPNPTIVEDDCFIGARSEVVEGCIVRKGSILGMGVRIGKSTKIVDRETGQIFKGEVPPYSVVVPGCLNGENGVGLCCAVIVKKVDEQTRAKTAINDILRGW